MNKDDLATGFFEDSLTADQWREFEQLLQNDSEFAAEIAFQKAVKQQLTAEKRAALKSELRAIENNKKKVILLNWKWISAAALLIFGVFSWVLTQKNKPKQSLYAAYYQPFPNVVEPTVRGENTSSEKSVALGFYDAENYAAALPLFEKLYQENPEDYSYFYQGICHLELGNTNRAITLFENASYTQTIPWQNSTDWYLALGYLKIGKVKKAKKPLEQVIAANDFMAKQAKELAKKM